MVTAFCVGYEKYIKILIIYKLADFKRHSVTEPTLDKLMNYTIESLCQFECR